MSPRFLLVAALAAMVAVTGLNAQNKPAPARSTAAQLAAAEADATESARLQARRYQIWAARLDTALTDADRAELEEIGRAVRAIEVKYEGPGMLELSVDVRNRTRERLIAQAAPAWNRALLARFPTPDRVRRDFPETLRAAAALEVLYYEFALGRTLRPPRTAEMDARDAAYRAAIQELEAPVLAGGEESKAWMQFTEEKFRLFRDAGFKREVLGRYVPLLASWVRDTPPEPTEAATPPLTGIEAWIFRPIGSLSGEPIFLGHAAIPAAAILGLLGCLVIPLRRARKAGRRHNAGRAPGTGTSSHPCDLPVELQVLALPGRMYPELTVTSGIVMEKEGWTETNTTYSSTAPTQHHGGSTTVSTTTTKKDRLWVRTTAGDEQPWTVTGDVFQARAGHPVTWVAARLRQDPQTVCMVFNHATGRYYEKPWIAIAHHGAFLTWVITILWIGLCAATSAVAEFGIFDNTGISSTVASGLAFLSVIWVPLARAMVRGSRERAWQSRYRPQLLAWLQLLGPAVAASAGNQPPPFTRAG